MEKLTQMLNDLLPAGVEAIDLLYAAAVLLGGVALIATCARLLFGQKNTLNHSISSAINILFIYVLTIVIPIFGADLSFLLSPLPFVNINGDHMEFFNFLTAETNVICNQLVSMIILAFIANLVDSILPQGEKVILWFLLRCISVLAAMLLHLFATAIIEAIFPAGLLEWAPTVLLGVLIVLIATGALKWVVGLLMVTVNPIIAALYTFFFASAVGKMLFKAVLTTAILSIVVCVLNNFGITSIFVAASALLIYVPFLLALVVVWYFVGHKM